MKIMSMKRLSGVWILLMIAMSCASDRENIHPTYGDLDLSFIPCEIDEGGIRSFRSPQERRYIRYVDVVSGKFINDKNPQLVDGSLFSDGLALVKIRDENTGEYRLGYLDKNGEILDSPLLKHIISATVFRDGRAFVSGAGTIDLIDKSGDLIKRLNYAKALPFSDGVALCADFEDRWTIIDRQGKPLAQLEHKYVPGFSSYGCRHYGGGYVNGLLMVLNRETGQYGLIDKSGKEVVPCEFDCLGFDFVKESFSYFYPDFVNGLQQGIIPAKKGNHWGLISTNGKEIIPIQYYHVHLDGNHVVISGEMEDEEKGSVWRAMYCDKSGKIIFGGPNEKVSFLEPFYLGRITQGYLEDSMYVNYDKKGKEFSFNDSIFVEDSAPEGFYIANLRTERPNVFGASGIIDRNGKWTLPPFTGANFYHIRPLPIPRRFIVSMGSNRDECVLTDEFGEAIIETSFRIKNPECRLSEPNSHLLTSQSVCEASVANAME